MIVTHILTANQLPHIAKDGGLRHWLDRQVGFRWPGSSPNWTVAGEAVAAWVYRSQWIVSCPDCNGALVAQPDVPFFCTNCQNAKNSGHARPVVWPSERLEIERLLKMRPDPITRNWLVSESVADLAAENILYGVSI